MNDEKRSKWKPRIKRTCKYGAITFGVLVALLLVVFGLAQSPFAKQRISSLAAQYASQALGYEIQVTGLRGFLPFRVTIDEIVIEDEEGVWLRIAQLSVTPNIAALLRGALSITEIHAGSIDCKRIPASTQEVNDEDSDASLEIPSPEILEGLPLVVIQRIGADRIQLATPVLGIEQAYSLEGHLLASDGGRLDASLLLISLRQPDALITIDATIEESPVQLRIAAHIQDPNGEFTRLAGLDDLGGIDIHLDGEGAMADWLGEFQLSSEKYGGVDLNLRLSWTDSIALGIEGEAAIAPSILDATTTRLIGDKVAFDVQAAWMQANHITVERLEAHFMTASLATQGEYYLDLNEIEGRLTLSVPELSVLQPFVDQRLEGAAEAALEIAGALLQPQAVISIHLTDLVYDTVEASRFIADVYFSPEESLDLADIIPAGSYQATGFIESLVLSATTPIHIERVDVEVAFDAIEGDALQIHHIDVHSSLVALQSWGVASPFVPSASLQFEGRVENPAEWGGFIAEDGLDGIDVLRGLRFGGRLVADASASTAISSIEAEIDVAPGLDDPIAQLVGDRIRFNADVELEDDTLRFSSTHVNVQNAGLSSEGIFELQTQTLQADWQARFDTVAPLGSLLGRTLSGAIAAEGTVTGALDAINAEARVRSENLVINDVGLDAFDVRMRVSESSGDIAGDVEGLLARDGMRLEFNTEYQLSQDRFQLSRLRVSGPGLDVEGSANVDLITGLIAGDFTGASSDLARLGELVNEPLQGVFDFAAQLQPVDGTQLVAVTLNASNIESQFGQLESLQASVNVRDLYGQADARIHAELSSFHLDDYSVDLVRVEATGDQGEIEWSAHARGDLLHPFSFESSGDIQIHETQTYRIASFEAEYADIPIHLTAPTLFEMSENRMRLGEINLRVGTGVVQSVGSMDDDAIGFELRARNLPLAWMEHAGVTNATGVLNLDGEIRGTPLQPIAYMTLRGERLRYHDDRLTEFPDADLLIEAEYASRNLNVTLRALEEVGQPVHAQARLPMELSLRPFHFDLPQHEPIYGRITGEFDLSIIPTLLYLEGQILAGDVTADMEFGGRLSDPTVSGGLELSNGRYDHMDFGVVLRNISMKLTADSPNRVLIEHLSMTDGARGTIQGQGYISLDPERPLDVAFAIHNAALIRMDEVEAIVTGTLSATGSDAGFNLAGDLTVAPIEVRIPRNLPQDIQRIPVTEIGRSAEVIEETTPSAEIPFGDQVRLDITVRIPNRLFVRGRGLDAEWQGTLNIRGLLSNPLITGNLSIIRGTFQFFNNPLRFDSGTVQFGGASPPDPYLNIIASTIRRGADIQLGIQGPASSPNLQLSSNPPMSSDEVLSYLLFGRHLTEITPLQAIQLAQAANTMRGGGGAFDLMGETRNLLGVDQIQVRMGEGGGFDDARIGIGKYLTDEIYVDFEQGYGNKSSAMNIEIRITPSIYLESELGMDKSSGIGVLWKFDF